MKNSPEFGILEVDMAELLEHAVARIDDELLLCRCGVDRAKPAHVRDGSGNVTRVDRDQVAISEQSGIRARGDDECVIGVEVSVENTDVEKCKLCRTRLDPDGASVHQIAARCTAIEHVVHAGGCVRGDVVQQRPVLNAGIVRRGIPDERKSFGRDNLGTVNHLA